MNDQPSFDRGLLIPIGVAIFSLLGICVLLVGGRITARRGSVEEIPTATAFQYALIGTEPVLVTVVMEDTMTNAPAADTEASPLVTRTARPTSETLIPITPNATYAGTYIALQTTTPATTTNTEEPARTPTSGSNTSLGSGTFDDSDTHMIYSGNWNRQAGISGAYQSTLHVSVTKGNSVFFRFSGQDLSVFFQAGPSMGLIQLKLDGKEYEMNEYSPSTQNYQWVLPSVNNGTHEVTITHLDGDSANIDYITVSPIPTPNP